MNQIMMSELEVKIDLLIRELQQLRSQNKLLVHKLRNTQANQSRLAKNNEIVTFKVKQIISQLKEACHE